MRKIPGRDSTLIVDGAGATWSVLFQDLTPAIWKDGKGAVFDSEREAIYWARWTLNEPDRIAAEEDDEDGQD
jgi:hypothetical protein